MLASLLQGGGAQQTEHRNRNGEMVQMRGHGRSAEDVCYRTCICQCVGEEGND